MMNSKQKIIGGAIIVLVLVNVAVFAVLFVSSRQQAETKLVQKDPDSYTEEERKADMEKRKKGWDANISGEVVSKGKNQFTVKAYSKKAKELAEYLIFIDKNGTKFSKMQVAMEVDGDGSETAVVMGEDQNASFDSIEIGQAVTVEFPQRVDVDNNTEKLIAKSVSISPIID